MSQGFAEVQRGFDIPQLANASAAVTKATLRAAQLLGLTHATLAAVIGLSEPTVSRMASGSYTLNVGSKPYELALLLVRLFRNLSVLAGNEEGVMRGWMRSTNSALGGVPAEQIRTVTGLVNAVDYVDGARARI